MNQPTLKQPGLRCWSLVPLIAGLLATLATAQAHVWSFNLVGAPTALNVPSPTGEYIQMMGSGTFDPDKGTVEASGDATVFNADDHILGPTIQDTWHSTGFVSFSADEGGHPGQLGGSLTIMIELDRVGGGLIVHAMLNVMENGITVDFLNPTGLVTEHYTAQTGSAHFNIHGKAE